MKRFAFSKDRKMKSERRADVGMEQLAVFVSCSFTTELTSNRCCCATSTLFSFLSSHPYIYKPKVLSLPCKVNGRCKYVMIKK